MVAPELACDISLVRSMPLGKGSLRSRAASLLRASTPSATDSIGHSANQEKGYDLASNPATASPLNEKTKVEEGPNGPGSPSGGNYPSSGSNPVANDRAAHRIVRTIPSQSSLLTLSAHIKTICFDVQFAICNFH